MYHRAFEHLVFSPPWGICDLFSKDCNARALALAKGWGVQTAWALEQLTDAITQTWLTFKKLQGGNATCVYNSSAGVFV